MRSSRRSRKGTWASRIFERAAAIENQAARSTSGNSAWRPDRGGHSIENVLLLRLAGSKSASRDVSCANAVTIFPLRCVTWPRVTNFPSALKPVSSSSSRFAAASGSSSARYSPLGIDHAPKSFFAQRGPPGWTSKTSRFESPKTARAACAVLGEPRRYNKIPALRFGMLRRNRAGRLATIWFRR
jgi:hypothetical protein